MSQTGFRQQDGLAQIASFELCIQILIGQQAGHGNRMAVKIVQHGNDLTVYGGKLRFKVAHHPFEERCGGGSGRNRQKPRISVIFGIFERVVELVHQVTQHPDAVFVLRVILVGVILRQRQTGEQIQFIGRIHDAAAVCTEAPALHRLDLLDGGTGGLLRKGGNRAEMLPEFRHAERHDCNRLHRRHHRKEVGKRLVEIVAVIPCRTQHDLAVHRNACFAHLPEIFQRLARFFIAEHFAAELRIGRLHRDIDRHMHFDDALDIMVGQVGQRDIAALQKGKARIVVLEIDRVAHSLRVLVDEAEDAVIAAGTLFVHEGGGKAEPRIVILALFQQKGTFLALPHDLDIQQAVRHGVAVVQHIGNHGAVNGNQAVARPDPRFLCRRAGGDFSYFDQIAAPCLCRAGRRGMPFGAQSYNTKREKSSVPLPFRFKWMRIRLSPAV